MSDSGFTVSSIQKTIATCLPADAYLYQSPLCAKEAQLQDFVETCITRSSTPSVELIHITTGHGHEFSMLALLGLALRLYTLQGK